MCPLSLCGVISFFLSLSLSLSLSPAVLSGKDWGEDGYFRTDEFLVGQDTEEVESLSASALVQPMGKRPASMSNNHKRNPLKTRARNNARESLNAEDV